MNCIEELVVKFKDQRPIRAGSLIMSIYGDAIVPRGGAVWLGSLINILEPLGLNQRLVRTSIFRLTKDGWLASSQLGRRSYYQITNSGLQRFYQAFERVYGDLHPDWHGEWDCLITSALDQESRLELKKQLGWQGFASVSSGLLVHPNCEMRALKKTLSTLGVNQKVIHMKSQLQKESSVTTLKSQVEIWWDLPALIKEYQGFIDSFEPILSCTKGREKLGQQESFLLRTLMIHHYRRILLKDPHLPEELLPSKWIGNKARDICRQLYLLVYQQSEQYLTQTQETATGTLPKAHSKYLERFGGLS